MRPITGVMPLWDDERKSLWMLPGYLDGIHEAGGIPVVLPLADDEEELEKLTDMCDGFLFTGGHDISPEIYHEIPLDGLISSCKKRDRMEIFILKKALITGKPVLGICRGIHLINGVLGGTLYQDLPSQHPSETNHHQTPPYDIPVHTVELVRDSPLYACLKKDMIPVNSYHHQAVKDLAPGLCPMAVSPDGLIESLYRPDHPFLWAVQWHPEYSFKTDICSRKIFESFVTAMKGTKKHFD